MATTRLMPLHVGQRRTVGTAIAAIIDYVENPGKTDNGRLITSNGYQPKEGDIISVRGMGKFRFAEEGGRTKKNRQCIVLHKYI